MAKIIYESGLSDFLADIGRGSRLYVPVYLDRKHHEQVAFKEWSPTRRLALGYPVTILPPTEFLMPHDEILFVYDGEEAKAVSPEAQIIFGLSLEDLESISRLDKLMKSPIEDETYKRRREKTFLIAVDKFSPPSNMEFDLYFQEFEPGVYAVTAKSRQGKNWLTGKHFKTQTVALPRVGRKPDPILSDPLLSKAIKDSADHPIWAELAKSCFGCGICSYVCPLCYCFDVSDRTNLGKTDCGTRCRQWDSCFLPDFATTNSRDFRSEPKDRLYNWYHHKFYRMGREYGFDGCVDCNRCVVYCPARINFRRTLATILNDYKKRPKR